jgi:hypothetical protein
VRAGGNPVGVRRSLVGVAGHTGPDPGLGRMTVVACLAGPEGSVPNRVGRQGI